MIVLIEKEEKKEVERVLLGVLNQVKDLLLKINDIATKNELYGIASNSQIFLDDVSMMCDESTELPRGKPTECWICRRTKEELVSQAKKDGLYPHYQAKDTILQECLMLKEIKMYDKPFSKYVCETCLYMIQDVVDEYIKNLIRDEVIKISFNE